MNFDEFRVLIQPDVHNPDNWSVSVANCSQDIFNVSHGSLMPVVTSDEINRLRNSTEPPDLAKLRQLGSNVLNSIMPPTALQGFQVCLQSALNNNRGLRLVVEIRGTTPTSSGISLLDLPFEAIFNNQLDFIATNVRTPVSRGVVTKIDNSPVTVNLPIRILLVTSEPSDMPPVNAAEEKQAILDALDPLIKTRAVVVDLCEPPTLAQFDKKLQEGGYHVVHFIGHGDYEIVGLDPNPQPHLYFEDETANQHRKATSAGQIFTLLRNGKVPLIILTACSTAAASPNGNNYPVIAFESLAQNLVERQFGPLAAVAMQFDLETQAAKIFSRAFYTKLLSPGWSLDAAVSYSRSALLGQFGEGHRSWVNPTVYWRCKDGKIFEIVDTEGSLTEQERAELLQIDAVLDVYLKELERLSEKSPEVRAAAANLKTEWEKSVEELMNKRGLILGDSIRLRGGKPDANGEIECILTIRLRLEAGIKNVQVSLQYDLADLNIVGYSHGKDVSPNSIFLQQPGSNQANILIQDAGNNISWNPGEYELAKIKFRLQSPTSKPLFHIQITNADVNKNNVSQQFRSLNAVIFGNL